MQKRFLGASNSMMFPLQRLRFKIILNALHWRPIVIVELFGLSAAGMRPKSAVLTKIQLLLGCQKQELSR